MLIGRTLSFVMMSAVCCMAAIGCSGSVDESLEASEGSEAVEAADMTVAEEASVTEVEEATAALADQASGAEDDVEKASVAFTMCFGSVTACNQQRSFLISLGNNCSSCDAPPSPCGPTLTTLVCN